VSFQPAVLALLVASALTSLLVLGAAWFALVVLRRWDLASGSELQLALERRTYLVSTLLAYVFGFQLVGLFLFVHTADDLARGLVGAMCAAGTLNANPWGYPAFGLKVATFVLAGLWLIVNAVDNRAEDYPLVRVKYGALLLLAPLILAEAVLQGAFLLSLRPDVITSCCGTLFSAGKGTLASGLAGLPIGPMRVLFFGSLGAALAAGAAFLRLGRGAVAFAALSGLSFAVGAASLVSFIGVYIYELPTHRCPFCVLQRDYGYVGYAIYLALLGGAVLGVGAGAIAPAARLPSLAGQVPRVQRRLVGAACALWALLAALVAWRMLSTDFRP
jgi:hypothetical protein